MMLRRARTVVIVTVALIGALPGPARAGGFADLFEGMAFTLCNDVDLRLDGSSSTATAAFKDSFSVGARAGYWWGLLGVNLDLSYFRPEFDPDETGRVDGVTIKTDLDVVGVGLNAMLRAQFLRTSAIPAGRLQPYVFGGPTLFISRFDARASGPVSGHETDVSTRPGLTVGGGLTLMLTRQLGLFGEYRFTRNRPEFNINGLTIEPHLDTHHALAGVTLSF